MTSIRQKLSDIFSAAFSAEGIDASFGEVAVSNRPDLSHFQCNGALPAAKALKKKPRDIAEAIRVRVGDGGGIIAGMSVDGPGFINITVSDAALAESTVLMKKIGELSSSILSDTRTTVIDFGSPNVAKPMHVGHLRSAIIGDALQRLCTYLGVSKVSINHLGDWGTQMGMLICALREKDPSLPYFDEKNKGPFPATPPVTIDDLETMYPVQSKKCKDDEAEMKKALEAISLLQKGHAGYIALWKHFIAVSTEQLKKEFAALGVHFDHWRGESYYHGKIPAVVEDLSARGIAAKSEGALVVHFDVSETGGREIAPLLLVKSDGAFLYGTTDLTALKDRISEFSPGRILYVVDKRQSLHFNQVFLAAKKSGYAKDTELLHVPFGTVNGKDGKPFKTREGGVMKLSDLISMVVAKARERMTEAGVADGYPEAERESVANLVGIAALKYADLINHRETDYIFDLDAFTRFEGKTGPYLLYTSVRIKSILRKAAERGFTPGALTVTGVPERALMAALARYPDVVVSAYGSLLPSHLCEYLFELAQAFNQFYISCSIINETDAAKRGAWLSLCESTLAVLVSALSVLGIDVPERM